MPTEERDELRAIDARLRETLVQADRERAEGLAVLAEVRQARRVALERDATILAKRAGRDDPRTMAMVERLKQERTFQEIFAREAERAARETPTPDPRTFTIHGYVTDRTGAGVAGARVVVEGHDPSPATDEHGHFAVRVPVGEERTTLRVRVIDASGADLGEATATVDAARGGLGYVILGTARRPPR
jgi:hypothetical protein